MKLSHPLWQKFKVRHMQAKTYQRLKLAHSPKFQGILEVAEQQIREGKGIQHEDFWREVSREKASNRKVGRD